MACFTKIGVGYVIVTNNVIQDESGLVYGINPSVYRSLPCEGVAVLKIRTEAPAGTTGLSVFVAVPASSTVTTVGDSTCCPVASIPLVNPVNAQVTGASMVNNTERLVYFNKVKGILRLLDCCTPATAATASKKQASAN